MSDWFQEHLVAVYAAIVSTGNLIWSVAVARRDRAHIRLIYKANMKVFNSAVYDGTKTYLVLTVINRGRRPVTVLAVGYQEFGWTGGFLTDSLMKTTRAPLDEINPSSDYLVEQSLVDLRKVDYFFVKDTAQRTYYLHPNKFWLFKRLYARLTRTPKKT